MSELEHRPESSHGFASDLSAVVIPATPPDLLAWLRKQIDEDERVARKVLADLEARGFEPLLSHDLRRTEGDTTTITRIVAYDPARVLREVEAKRRIIALHYETELESEPDHDPMGAGCAECGHFDWPCETLRLLALPYADRPGYREEWRP